MTAEEFAAIDKLSTLAQVAMEDFRNLSKKTFYPHHARFVSTTDHFNHFSIRNTDYPAGHCAVCLAGAVLVRTLNLPTPSTEIRDAFGNRKLVTFSDDPQIDEAIKNRIIAIENMRIGEFDLAYIQLFPDNPPDCFPLPRQNYLDTQHANFIGWNEANAFLANWESMIKELKTAGF